MKPNLDTEQLNLSKNKHAVIIIARVLCSMTTSKAFSGIDCRGIDCSDCCLEVSNGELLHEEEFYEFLDEIYKEE